MASIKISELCPPGSELFHDSESFLNQLNEQEFGLFGGGGGFVLGILSGIISQANGSIASQGSISGGNITLSVGATFVANF
jgi:hypothetical protein